MKYLLPILLFLPVSASAQCAKLTDVINVLNSEFHEKAFAEMIDQQNRKVIIFVSPDTNTYTVMMTNGEIACGVSAGTNFGPVNQEKYKPQEPEKKKDPT